MVEVVYTAERVLPQLDFVGKKLVCDVNDTQAMINFRDEVLKSKELETLQDLDNLFDDSLVSLMINEDEFSYWVGYFFNDDNHIDDSFDKISLPKSRVLATWVRGKQSTNEIYGQDAVAQSMLALKKSDIISDINFDKIHYYYERYDQRRFKVDNDETILDYGFYIQD